MVTLLPHIQISNVLIFYRHLLPLHHSFFTVTCYTCVDSFFTVTCVDSFFYRLFTQFFTATCYILVWMGVCRLLCGELFFLIIFLKKCIGICPALLPVGTRRLLAGTLLYMPSSNYWSNYMYGCFFLLYVLLFLA